MNYYRSAARLNRSIKAAPIPVSATDSQTIVSIPFRSHSRKNSNTEWAYSSTDSQSLSISTVRVGRLNPIYAALGFELRVGSRESGDSGLESAIGTVRTGSGSDWVLASKSPIRTPRSAINTLALGE